jgi:hypothetical protein
VARWILAEKLGSFEGLSAGRNRPAVDVPGVGPKKTVFEMSISLSNHHPSRLQHRKSDQPDGRADRYEGARWCMPGPPQYGDQPVTNIRNVKSPHWH